MKEKSRYVTRSALLRIRFTLVLALYLLAGIGGGLWHGLDQCDHASAAGLGIAAPAHEGDGEDDHHSPLCPSHRDCRTCSLLQTHIQLLPAPDVTADLAVAEHARFETTVVRPPQAAPASSRAPPSLPS